ncbi:trypsin-like peptidase domain-containing protein [Actinacidiphila alni]|uniref:VMAP-C domain-containing protein n=1 Tax=Actinacidiphila alni TaxID=380248 RepID=UPI003455E08A
MTYGTGADPDAPVLRAWATISAAGAAEPVGGGVVVADGYVLTCAHVVNAALGRGHMAGAEPTPAELAALDILLPGAGPDTYRPELACWSPPVDTNDGRWDGDLALLRLPPTAPRIVPVPIGDALLGSTAWAWHADGDGRTVVDVRVQKPFGSWLLLDPGAAQLPVVPGYSGGPLWDSATGTLVGIVVCVEPEVRRYYAIGPADVRVLLTRAGVAVPARAREPWQARLHKVLADALDDLPTDRYDRGLDRFVRALYLPHRPTTVSDVVNVALDLPRGVPALRDAFTASRWSPESASYDERLIAAARLGRPAWLLAPEDHAELCEMLADLLPQNLLAAARSAVPHLSLRVERLPDHVAFIEALEDRESDPGVMPPLLQVVEEIAVRHHRTCDDLRAWSTRVADRLRVKSGALEQIRALAETRAASTGPGRPVVRVWLSVCDRAADTYTYIIRLYDGDDRSLETWSAADTPRGHEEMCDELAEAVDRLSDYQENAGVEFLLEHGSFDLPIDRWRIPSGELEPRRIGGDRFVVLRGQNPPRRDLWEHRWQRLGSAASVLHDVEDAEDALGEDLDAAFVIAACPPRDVNMMVQMCRWFGVPVVLWHRQAAGEDAARALLELVGDDWPQDLREQVRRRRHKARRDDRHLGAHLSLLWEDPRWEPSRARLTEPRSKGGAV